MAKPLDIRTHLIARNAAELATYGVVFSRSEKIPGKAGRPSKAFYLNEEQALLVVMFSRTLKAAEARREIIAVFQAYRRGELARAPQPKLPQTYLEALGSLVKAKDNHSGNR